MFLMLNFLIVINIRNVTLLFTYIDVSFYFKLYIYIYIYIYIYFFFFFFFFFFFCDKIVFDFVGGIFVCCFFCVCVCKYIYIYIYWVFPLLYMCRLLREFRGHDC